MQNSDLWNRREAAIPRGVGNMHQVFAQRAENAEIWDEEGNHYIDFASGIAVNNTGHNHPRIQKAVQEQLKAFSHVCFQVSPYKSYIELAERLNEAAPGDTPKKTIFLTTGAEAVENAVKIARSCDRPPSRDLVYRRLPRAHDDEHGADGQGRAIQGWASDRCHQTSTICPSRQNISACLSSVPSKRLKLCSSLP